MSKTIIDLTKTIYELYQMDPEIVKVLAAVGFNDITKPGMITTAGRFMTIPKGAAMKKIDLEVIKQAFIHSNYEIKEN